MKPSVVLLSAVVLLPLASAFAYAQDSASVLARILADNGTISPSELAQVEAAAPADRVRALTDLLQRKGVLSASEVARVNAPANGAVTTSQLMPTTTQTGQRSAAQLAGTSSSQTTAGPAAPALTAQSHFPVTVYGTLLINSVYDTASMNITDIPLFTGKQGSDALGNDKAFAMTARQSRLGLRYESQGEIAGARLSGQVEIDFLGGKAPFGNGVDMDLPRLRLAYGRMDWNNFSLEAGQDWVIFAPLNPTSLAEFAIPSLSASGNPWIRLPQIRAEAHGSLGGGLNLLTQFAAIDPDMGDYSTTTFSSTRPPGAGERGRAPGAEARFALTEKHDDRDFTLGFSGHFTHGKNSGAIGNVTEQLSLNSWGAAVDYALPFSNKFNLTGELYTGRALGIFSVTTGEAIQPVGTVGDRGVRSSGGWTQAQFNFTTKWQTNLAYGIDSPSVRDLPVGLRTRNQSYMGNIIYKYTQHVSIAWEYRRLLTDFRNQLTANERGDTANLALAYIF
jgi:hypothetical protein